MTTLKTIFIVLIVQAVLLAIGACIYFETRTPGPTMSESEPPRMTQIVGAI